MQGEQGGRGRVAEARRAALDGALVGSVIGWLQLSRIESAWTRLPLEAQGWLALSSVGFFVVASVGLCVVCCVVPGVRSSASRRGLWVGVVPWFAWIGSEAWIPAARSELWLWLAGVGLFALADVVRRGALRGQILWAGLAGVATTWSVLEAASSEGGAHGGWFVRAAIHLLVVLAVGAVLRRAGAFRLARWGGLAGLLATTALPWAARPLSAKAPCVIVISLDTLRADHLGCYGSSVQTPAIDAFVQESVLFEEAITPYPLTNPAHATMMTGLYPGNHGLVLNGPIGFRPGTRTLPERLADEGYRTAAFVSGYPLKRRMSAMASRFQVYEDDFSPWTWLPEAWFLHGAPRFLLERVVGHDATKGGHERGADEVVPRVRRWLRHQSDQPFFLFVHLYDAHGPYVPPAPYDTMYDPDYEGAADGEWYALTAAQKAALIERPEDVAHVAALYAGEVSWLDHQVGRLLDELKRLGRFDNSLVVVTADHGESLTEHDYYFDHGHRLYDPSLHVPLVMHLPEAAFAGTRVQGQVTLMDLTPTTIDALGLDLEEVGGDVARLDGVSLLSACASGTSSDTPYVVSSIQRHRWGAPPRIEALSLRTSREKYVSRSTDEDVDVLTKGTEEWFDLTSDPREEVDHSSERADRLEAARVVLTPLRDRWRQDEAVELSLSDADRAALEALGYLDRGEPDDPSDAEADGESPR